MHQEASFFADPKNWVMIAFFLFFILFGGKLWRALAGILDARTNSVRAELEEASRLRREAEAMLADAEKQRASALTEAKALIESARSSAASASPRSPSAFSTARAIDATRARISGCSRRKATNASSPISEPAIRAPNNPKCAELTPHNLESHPAGDRTLTRLTNRIHFPRLARTAADEAAFWDLSQCRPVYWHWCRHPPPMLHRWTNP